VEEELEAGGDSGASEVGSTDGGELPGDLKGR
jgi:hypothetical protein